MASAESSSDGRTLLERALSIITEVRAGEGITAILLTLNVFSLMTSYYVIKPVREGLILQLDNGEKIKSYVSAAIAVTLLFAVPIYGKVKDRVPRNKLVVGVTLFFASHLVIFWVLSHIPAAEKNLGAVFFIWVGVFNMMVVAQFWAFANDLYTQEKGKRLFAILGLGASLGAAVGSEITAFLEDTMKIGIYQLLFVACGLLVLSAFLSQVVHARETRLIAEDKSHQEEKAKEEEKKKEEAKKAEEAHPEGGFTLVFKNKYLLLLAAFSLVYTIVDTNGEFILSTLVKERATKMGGVDVKEFISSYYASFFLWVNIFGLVIQTFLVSRIVKFGGIKTAFFIYPIITLLSSLNLIFLAPILGLQNDKLKDFRPTKTAENATDYSLNATVRNMLWLPTTTEMKYKAKQAVDTFFVRMGDVSSAGFVFVFAQTLKMPIQGFSMINVVCVIIWLLLAIGIVRENARLSKIKEERESGKDVAAAT